MTAILMIEYRLPTEAVSDYSEWKEVFDTDPVGREAHGAAGLWIHRDETDPNHFMLRMEFPTVAEARGFLNEPTLKRSWEISGAGASWVLEEGFGAASS